MLLRCNARFYQQVPVRERETLSVTWTSNRRKVSTDR